MATTSLCWQYAARTASAPTSHRYRSPGRVFLACTRPLDICFSIFGAVDSEILLCA